MNAEQIQVVLAMMRHEYSDYPVSHLKSEKERKIFAGDHVLCGYVLTKSEMVKLFDKLIKERT